MVVNDLLNAACIGGIVLEDARHIVIAAVNGLDAVVTWNFAHMDNPFTRVKVRTIVEEAGCRRPEMCSPKELLETDK